MATAHSDRTAEDYPKPRLHLPPRSISAQRIWQVDGGQVSEPAGPIDIRLQVLPDRHDAFASLRSILNQLRPLAAPRQLRELATLDGYLREACPDFAPDATETHGRFLADAVTFAIMRRISRESQYTSRVIDTGARALNAILSRLSDCRRVHVPSADRLDRPTLKVLARAMLLLERSHGFSWIWHLATDPTTSNGSDDRDVYALSRSGLMRQLFGILWPTLKRRGGALPLGRPQAETGGRSLFEIASNLVLQNYDACFLWTDAWVESGLRAEAAEARRLRALAAINVGMTAEALKDLTDAERMSLPPGRRAHLCYLQGLIGAKRRYSLGESGSHYQRGLSYLEAADGQDGDGEDLPLERGWLLNGLALNEAILARGSTAPVGHYNKALALEHEAFALVREGQDPARAYLRFNLLANCALLLEMQENYDLAIEVFTKTFDFTMAESPTIRRRARRSLGYRVGVLHYRAQRMTEAYRLLHDAAEQDAGMDNWATQERILRALGSVATARGDWAEAAGTFAKGLELCRDARSVEGTREHARGLISALLRAGRDQQAMDVAETVAREEGLAVVDEEALATNRLAEQTLVSPPSPKLPAYIPEIDLEGIPAIDINRFLGNALWVDSPKAVPWGD